MSSLDFDLDLVAACVIVVATAIATVIWILNQTGRMPRAKRARDWEIELELADRKSKRLEEDLAVKSERLDLLERTRSLEPVLALLERVAGGVDATLEKLANFNGSLAHTEQGLREATAAMRALAEVVGEQTRHP